MGCVLLPSHGASIGQPYSSKRCLGFVEDFAAAKQKHAAASFLRPVALTPSFAVQDIYHLHAESCL